MKILNLLLLLLAMLLFSGCGENSAPAKGSVSINTTPEGAIIYVGEKAIGITPKKFSGFPGKRRVRIAKAGYQTRWVDFIIRGGKTTQIDEKLIEDGCNVLVETTPKNANVVLNGRQMGLTPLVLSNIMPGQHDLIVKKIGYAERSVQLNVPDSRPLAIRINITSNLGQVIINSDPSDARITIDGKPYGFTPFRGTLAAGVHQLRLDKTGALPLETTFQIERNGIFKKSYTLGRSPGLIQIDTNPVAVSVYLDDKLVGVSPITLKDVAAGVHEVRLEKQGFDTITKKVDVAPDSLSEVSEELLNSKGELHLAVIPAGVSVYLNNKFLGVVKQQKDAAVNRTEMIRVGNLSPGKYKVTVAHKRAIPERKEIIFEIKKGKVKRPEPIVMWVPNAEIKWSDTGFVETGMLYAETAKAIYFGAEPGIRIRYARSRVEYIKHLNINE